jgi:hypothetical protein
MMIGMMFLWPLFLLLLLALPIGLAVGAYLLYRNGGRVGGLMPAAVETGVRGYSRACAACGRFLQEDWIGCPHCGAEVPQATKS